MLQTIVVAEVAELNAQQWQIIVVSERCCVSSVFVTLRELAPAYITTSTQCLSFRRLFTRAHNVATTAALSKPHSLPMNNQAVTYLVVRCQPYSAAVLVLRLMPQCFTEKHSSEGKALRYWKA